MKTIFIILTFITITAQAEMVVSFDNAPKNPYKYQMGLGYSFVELNAKGLTEKISLPSIQGKIGIKGSYSGDVDLGLTGDLGYFKETTVAIFLANLQAELGWRFYIGEKFSFAPHATAGAGYMIYENNKQSWSQINEIKGIMFSYGANIEADMKIKENLTIGAKLQWNKYHLNINTDSSVNALTPSAFLQYNF